MSLYLEQIRQLVSLQHVDDAIHDVDQELEDAPKELEALQEKFAAMDKERERILDKISHLKEQGKRIKVEIEDESRRIKKSKSKLMQVSNAREYQAMAREIDNMERSNRTREDEKTTVIDEKLRQDALLQELDEPWAELKAELESRQANLEEHLAEIRARRVELEEKRREVGNIVPKPVLQRYEFIRHRLPHPVIVSVSRGVCSGCQIAIPPQTYNELQSGHKIINCPNCQRLIYWEEHFREDAANTEESSAEKE